MKTKAKMMIKEGVLEMCSIKGGLLNSLQRCGSLFAPSNNDTKRLNSGRKLHGAALWGVASQWERQYE